MQRTIEFDALLKLRNEKAAYAPKAVKKCAHSRALHNSLSVRACDVEILESRRLLTVDLSTAPPVAATSDVVDSTSDLIDPTAIRYEPQGVSQPAGTAGPTGMQPSQIQHAYGFDQITFSGAIAGSGAGQTIAIVDAYDTPTIAHDLQAFDTAFHLPAPPSFVRVAQDGSTNYPAVDPRGAGVNNWEVETALDVEWAHALAPLANIVLVEATTNGQDLWTAVDYARNLPNVSVVSMSWGSPESIATDNDLFTTPAGHIPITFVASTGDGGVPGVYPAFSPNVLAVGGTTLTLNSSNNITNETGWSGSGGGISQAETQPSYQSGVVTQSTVYRTIPDVSFDADPSSGASVYDSYNNGTTDPWEQIGGTSFAAPSWAALIAIADQGRTLNGLSTLDGANGTLPALYGLPSTDFRDITSGNNGDAAGTGYDLVTGRGSPLANLVVAGLVSASTITGSVFVDANNNGVDDAGETGLAGVTVYDDLNNNGKLDPPAVSTISSTFSPGLAIPDGTGNVTSTLNVGNLNGSIMDVNVNLTIQHTRDSNLTVTLISPSGTSVTLISHNGGNGANFNNTTLDDQAGTSIGSGAAPFTGSFIPSGSLATLIGQNPQGTWQLVVADTVSGNTGTLVNWSLQILTPTEPSVTTDASGNYSFTSVTPGVHHLRDVLPATFTQTSPVGGVQNVTASAGLNAMSENFGQQGSTVSGTVFLDGNSNGLLDTGEIGIPGYVFDDLNNNGVWDTTTTWPVSSTDVPKTIADQSTTISSTMVTGVLGSITDLNVNLSITHPRDSDLEVILISPNGVYVPLINHDGKTGANFTNTTLDDQASRSLTSGTAPFSNTYRPASPLSAFNGLNPNGVWKLMVVDSVSGDVGTLTGWSLRFTTNAAEPLVSTTNGSYQIAGLEVGAHHLRTLAASTMTETSPAGGAYNVTVSAQTSIANDNFGLASSISVLTGGPYVINEGSSLTLNGSATGGNGTLNYNWDLNGDGIYGDAVGPDPTLTWSQLVALGISNGPELFNVRLRVDDGNLGVGLSSATTLTVLNVAPTANAGGPYTINEGSPLTLAGIGFDPVDALTYSWDVNGDGIFGDAVGANPTLTWSQLVSLGVNNGPETFNVSVRVNDGDGGITTSAPTTLTVLNVAPTANAGGPYTINEGSPLTLAGIGFDPVDALTYSWDVNGDGIFGDAVGATPTLTWSQLVSLGVNNGPETFNVSVRVNDGDGGITTSAPTTLTVLNVAPTANAGGPYTINEGSPLTLAGIGFDPVDALTYSWDVNGDGIFGDAVGATPTLTWSQLVALGINNGPAAFNVSVRVDDGDGGVTTSAPTSLTVNNLAPVASISGPATALRNQGITFTLGATDASPTDQAAGFNFTIDWGDGSPVQMVSGASGTQVLHSYSVGGAVLASVTATDQDGGVSAPAVQGIGVALAALQPDAQNPALMDLGWTGSSSSDQVHFTQLGPTTIQVTETQYGGIAVNNVQVFQGVTGRVIAYGQAGDDLLDARGLSTVSATLDGGGGNNTLYGGDGGDLLIGGSDGAEAKQGNNVIIAGNGDNTIYGNSPTVLKSTTGGNNLIVGGTGHDVIYGNFGTNVLTSNNTTGDGGEGGQNLIVGGGGGDTIYASQIADGAEGGHGSIVVAGSTTLSQTALLSILSEWSSTDTLAVKMANLTGAPSSLNLNGANYLIPGSTILDDGVVDQVIGNSNGQPDWLFSTFAQDVVTRTKSTDTLTDLG